MNLKKKWQSYMTVIIFCLLIFGFAAVTIVKPPSEFSETENRVLTRRPELKAEAIFDGDFQTNYEEYLADQFVWRNQWIGLKTLVERTRMKSVKCALLLKKCVLS